MTLLELLVKELPKRGGWPEGAVQSWQSVVDGEIYFDSSCGKRVEYRNGNIYLPIVGNGLDEAIIRDQYEAAIAAQQPVWNGEGLPPVGCECEYETIKGNWRKCRVMYIGEKCNIIRTDEWGEVSCGLSVKFRPIRTEADRKREEIVKQIIKGACLAQDNVAEAIYDAIAAGKIPGVELSK